MNWFMSISTLWSREEGAGCSPPQPTTTLISGCYSTVTLRWRRLALWVLWAFSMVAFNRHVLMPSRNACVCVCVCFHTSCGDVRPGIPYSANCSHTTSTTISHANIQFACVCLCIGSRFDAFARFWYKFSNCYHFIFSFGFVFSFIYCLHSTAIALIAQKVSGRVPTSSTPPPPLCALHCCPSLSLPMQ